MIYKTTVPMNARGRLVWVSSEDRNIDIGMIGKSTDAIMMQMCTQASGTMLIVKDGAFQTWVDRSNVPVFGVVGMDQNLFWNKEIDLNKFRLRTMWNNETLRAIIEQWRSEPIPSSEWDAKKLIISSMTGWHNLDALVLHMITTHAKGSLIGGQWQQAIVDDLLKPITTLMQGGYIPNIPIYVVADTNWYKTYTADTGWEPIKRIEAKQLAGLGMARVWGRSEPGLIEEVPMASTFPSLADVWDYVPSLTYSYPVSVVVDPKFFVFSYQRLRADDMFYPSAQVSPVTCAVWCDTAAEMYKAIGHNVPPVVTPSVDPTIEALQLENDQLKSKIATWRAWYDAAPKG